MLVVNLELWLLRHLIDELTKDVGYLFKELHQHPLFYDGTTLGHTCDLCRMRIREAYRYPTHHQSAPSLYNRYDQLNTPVIIIIIIIISNHTQSLHHHYHPITCIRILSRL